MSDPDEGIKGLMEQISVLYREIRKQTFTTKTIGENYPIRKGYAEAVRRPMGDLLNWMARVELVLEILVNELEIVIQDKE